MAVEPPSEGSHATRPPGAVDSGAVDSGAVDSGAVDSEGALDTENALDAEGRRVGQTVSTVDATEPKISIDLREDERSIPFVDMAAVHESIEAELQRAVQSVIANGDFILGGAVRAFEGQFAEYIGTAHAIGVDSGFSALELLLRAHGIGKGDEVITVANTFFATAMAIRAAGATPVLVDIDPATHLIEPSAVEGAISARTRAIMPVHLYGRVADMVSLRRIADRYGLVLIEDAAQAHGAGPTDARAGALGDGAAFSFYPSKNLGALGDGGMVTVSDPDVADRIRLLRNLGSAEKYIHEQAGFNRRLDTLHAAALSIKLPRLDSENAMRRATARLYGELLADLPIALPEFDQHHVFHLYVIETDRRDALADHLRRNGIASGIHYPVPIHLQPAFSDLRWRAGDFPRSERAAGRILSLPMFPRMKQRDTERVAEAIRRFFN